MTKSEDTEAEIVDLTDEMHLLMDLQICLRASQNALRAEMATIERMYELQTGRRAPTEELRDERGSESIFRFIPASPFPREPTRPAQRQA